MNFNVPLLKPIRILLLPVSLIYGLVIRFRNFAYDHNWLGSSSFNLPVICIGNLAAGGTGKSPMVEFLIDKLKDRFRIAVLSRGYKRKTKGYALAGKDATALEIGDEPMQFHSKFPDVTIAVGEERVVAIPQLLHDRSETQAILLDDAFQHRSVRAGFNILLTDFNNLFTRDWFLPTGDLRDEKRSYRRANCIIVTKCRKDLSLKEKKEIISEIKPAKEQHVFFSMIRYSTPYHINTRSLFEIDSSTEVLLVTGIANPASLKSYLNEQAGSYYELGYGDHHIFRIDDLKNIAKRFEALTSKKKIILTTEKDAVRLIKFGSELRDLPFYVMPITPEFLFGEQKQFTDLIVRFISDFQNHT